MMALAPGRFSTRKDWPMAVLRSCATMRAMTSVGPPAPKPTTKRTGFEGKSCACAALASSRRKARSFFMSVDLQPDVLDDLRVARRVGPHQRGEFLRRARHRAVGADAGELVAHVGRLH